jgi:ThiF family protein
MQTILKIPRQLFEQAKADLLRPHAFAYERVGFFSTRCSRTKSKILVHCIAYNSVTDEHYIMDSTVGARIGSDAITEAMGHAVISSIGQIHVHYHGGAGLPHPSPTDSTELPALSRSLRNANAKEANGWMILGNEDAWVSLLLPNEFGVISECPVTIVGFPTTANRRSPKINLKKIAIKFGQFVKRKKLNARYNRQSFLGAKSEAIIGQTSVGVIGLGGGGSHIVQQLAHLGFKNYVLCDHDRISESNLNRLVGGTRSDVQAKRLKTLIAERTIKKLHKDANIFSYACKWEEARESLIGCDLIIGCVDSFCARRDLEAFCRRHLIPYLDVGMDVHELASGRFEIYGQIILSMPSKPCMHCMGFLNETVLGQEAQKYGAAGSKPQVVWSNGLLCSAAVGVAVDMLTDWSKTSREAVYLGFKGSELSLIPDKRLISLRGFCCPHFPLNQVGDAVLKCL